MTEATRRTLEIAAIEKTFAELKPVLESNKVGFIVVLCPITEGVIHGPISVGSNFQDHNALDFALDDAKQAARQPGKTYVGSIQ